MVDSQFEEECLKYHNTLRALHNSPDLVIDIKLNDFAQDWALTIAEKDILEHRQENDYGENLYVGYNSDPEWKLEAQVPVQSWYEEISNYKFGEPSPKNPSAVGHFTQIVWKNSQKLGVGVAIAKSGKVYVVCNYEPAGNVLGEFPNNVAPKENTVDYDTAGPETVTLSERSKPGVTSASVTFSLDPVLHPNSSKSGARLSTIPSEELRVWSAWLTKVAEKVEREWQDWLLAHINLTLRLNESLAKAKEELEKAIRNELEESKSVTIATVEKRSALQQSDSATIATKSEEDLITRIISFEGKVSSATETKDIEPEKTSDNVEEDNMLEDSIDIASTSRKVNAKEFSLKSQSKNFPIIPIPKDENEMLEIIKEFKHRAKRYQSLYKYWLETADKVEEAIGKQPPASQEEGKYLKQMSFFFRLFEGVDANADSGNDDEDDESRYLNTRYEGIACKNLRLFFNLADETEEAEHTSSSKISLNKTPENDVRPINENMTF